jgi:hypothetical protein
VALEYTLPHVASSQLMYGGMGLVVDTFLKVSGAWCGTNSGMSIRHALLLAWYVSCVEGGRSGFDLSMRSAGDGSSTALKAWDCHSHPLSWHVTRHTLTL